MSRSLLLVVSLALALPAAGSATATSPLVYSNDFSAAAGPSFNTATLTTAPNGEQFLGVLSNQQVVLTLTDLPAHSAAIVDFDFYALLSLDGNAEGYAAYGPDFITVGFGTDSSQDWTTTFSNYPGFSQSYPEAYPAVHPSATGAYSVNGLGYSPFYSGAGDTEYHMQFVIPHEGTTLIVKITGSNQQGWPDEGWGIDNMQVHVDSPSVPAPELPTFVLAGLGMAAVAAVVVLRRR